MPMIISKTLFFNVNIPKLWKLFHVYLKALVQLVQLVQFVKTVVFKWIILKK